MARSLSREMRRRALQKSLTALALAWGSAIAVAGAAVASGSAGSPEAAEVGLVHCLLPGQVRRLGAFSSSLTPRRPVYLSPSQCMAAGGEYAEAQDPMATVKLWLPMAYEGVAEAQTTVGESFELHGDLV